MVFEVFDRDMGGVATAGFPQVLIGRTGHFVLNAEAKAALDKIQAGVKMVELLYDRDTREVAIRPADSASPGSKRFAVAAARSKEWPLAVDAREFAEFWKLPVGRQQAFRVESRVVVFSSVLVFDLREVSGEVA